MNLIWGYVDKIVKLFLFFITKEAVVRIDYTKIDNSLFTFNI